MGKYIATLVGDTDGWKVTREFDDLNRAKGWLQRDGLVEFNDQTARGEILHDSKVVWARSHLQLPDQAERTQRLEGHRLLARLNLTPRRKP